MITVPRKKLTLILSLCAWMMASLSTAQVHSQQWKQILRQTDESFYKTDEAQRIGEQLMLYQRVTGGWPKNINMVTPLTQEQREQVMADKHRTDDSTTDNDATNIQMHFLARLFHATHDKQVRESFCKAVEYLLSGQYDNGGWPQYWPNSHGYQVHITYNDDAMVNTMLLLRAVAEAKTPFEPALTSKELRKRAGKAFEKGVECILKTQICMDGQLTVWCQQHDRDNFLPAPARAFELPSFCSQESASIVSLLMSLPHPDDQVKSAVHAAMKWFDTYKLTGLRLERTFSRESGMRNVRLLPDPNGRPLWARYYDLENTKPFVCDRDGIPRQRLEDIGYERRNGYAWYGDRPASLYSIYEQWADKYDPANKVVISLSTKGANENGLVNLFEPVRTDPALFDAMISPGESIQTVIDRVPRDNNRPYTIFLRKGTYAQKVIISRPHIVLVGEDRDSTILILAETKETQTITEHEGKPVGNGVVVLQEGADDCVISGLTVYNNYGTTVENTTRHQMAVFGRATRTIIVNCNIWADGNDALSLWAPEGNGMYYHADLSLRCPGVDFLCPRGWCYATRCRFYGDSRAIVWHDGRGDKSKKLVITNSHFDAASPTVLGRYHHDSQFFFVSCTMSKNILDSNISYAYTDKVLDPCPWGQRVYFYDCTREGGHGTWMNNNLSEADGAPEYHTVTANWTFNRQWDPEKTVRELWKYICY